MSGLDVALRRRERKEALQSQEKEAKSLGFKEYAHYLEYRNRGMSHEKAIKEALKFKDQIEIGVYT